MLRPVSAVARHSIRRVFDAPKGEFPIVHHGIQRSGTNYLCAILERGNYKVINKIDPQRNNPRHKHTRWQHDKSTINMDTKYVNEVTASSVESLNRICGYGMAQKHVVLFREPRPWIDAVWRWGLNCEWFPDTATFLDERIYEKYLKEWDAYYSAWESLQGTEPEKVLILSYEALKENPIDALDRIDEFMGIQRENPVDLRNGVAKVRHSNHISQKRVGIDCSLIDDVIDRGFQFRWRRYLDRGTLVL